MHQLGPQAFGLVVIEKDIAFIQPAGHAERKLSSIDTSGVNYSRLGQRSEGYRQRLAVQRVVYHLVQV